MPLFGFFRKKDDPPKSVQRIFHRLSRQMEGRKLADQALSYCNVGNFKKAFELLKKALEEYDYKPAITLIGTTGVLKGDIDMAIEWFTGWIEHVEVHNDYPLIELYANLGSIYFKYRKDYNLSLQMYKKGLSAPRASGFEDLDYTQVVSLVYHDMAVVYWHLKDIPLAREYAAKRLQSYPDCADCKEILAGCEDAMKHKMNPKRDTSSENLFFLNASGDLGGYVSRDSSGWGKICLGPDAGLVGLLWSMAIAASSALPDEMKKIISRWAELPDSEWSRLHQEVYALAMMHFYKEIDEKDSSMPPELRGIAKEFSHASLPRLKKPLSYEVKNMFRKHFGMPPDLTP